MVFGGKKVSCISLRKGDEKTERAKTIQHTFLKNKKKKKMSYLQKGPRVSLGWLVHLREYKARKKGGGSERICVHQPTMCGRCKSLRGIWSPKSHGKEDLRKTPPGV